MLEIVHSIIDANRCRPEEILDALESIDDSEERERLCDQILAELDGAILGLGLANDAASNRSRDAATAKAEIVRSWRHTQSLGRKLAGPAKGTDQMVWEINRLAIEDREHVLTAVEDALGAHERTKPLAEQAAHKRRLVTSLRRRWHIPHRGELDSFDANPQDPA